MFGQPTLENMVKVIRMETLQIQMFLYVLGFKNDCFCSGFYNVGLFLRFATMVISYHVIVKSEHPGTDLSTPSVVDLQYFTLYSRQIHNNGIEIL